MSPRLIGMDNHQAKHEPCWCGETSFNAGFKAPAGSVCFAYLSRGVPPRNDRQKERFSELKTSAFAASPIPACRIRTRDLTLTCGARLPAWTLAEHMPARMRSLRPIRQ